VEITLALVRRPPKFQIQSLKLEEFPNTHTCMQCTVKSVRVLLSSKRIQDFSSMKQAYNMTYFLDPLGTTGKAMDDLSKQN
jgi:hypothetical protein